MWVATYFSQSRKLQLNSPCSNWHSVSERVLPSAPVGIYEGCLLTWVTSKQHHAWKRELLRISDALKVHINKRWGKKTNCRPAESGRVPLHAEWAAWQWFRFLCHKGLQALSCAVPFPARRESLPALCPWWGQGHGAHLAQWSVAIFWLFI